MNWRHHFKLKDLLAKEDCEPDEIKILAQLVVQRLDMSPPVFGEFHNRLKVGFELVGDQDEFNEVLSDLYDVADLKKVWVE